MAFCFKVVLLLAVAASGDTSCGNDTCYEESSLLQVDAKGTEENKEVIGWNPPGYSRSPGTMCHHNYVSKDGVNDGPDGCARYCESTPGCTMFSYHDGFPCSRCCRIAKSGGCSPATHGSCLTEVNVGYSSPVGSVPKQRCFFFQKR